MSEYKIVIIGSTENIKPFLALGVSAFETQDPAAALAHIKEIENSAGLILIAESLAEQIMPEIERIKLRPVPAVFILPEYGSSKQLGLKRMEKTLARAIGKKL